MVKSRKSAKTQKNASIGFLPKRCLTTDKQDYEVALKVLNSLQSNAATIAQSKSQGPLSHVMQAAKVEATTKYLSRIGVSLDTLDNLSVIHIAGTKGKGTTAALCESILRHHGYRTGLFTSPHLVEARERIRLNGAPISYRQFADYVDHVHKRLDIKKENDLDMPAYFKFLTVMAFYVFLRERVDVAVIEVGIGGEYDCTNCIRKPAVVGITTLGLDHTNILGPTLQDIAWQKAGILKPNAEAYTVPQVCPAAMDVLRERAVNRKCKLSIAPPLESYTWDRTPAMTFTNIIEDVYSSNASLALQLTNAWLRMQSPFYDPEVEGSSSDSEVVAVAKPCHVTHKMADGFEKCTWPGRTQILRRGAHTFFLDGAHTEDSIAYCTRWFQASSSSLFDDSTPARRILIFNTTGGRSNSDFLSILHQCGFDSALFSAIVPFPHVSDSSDFYSKISQDTVHKLEGLSNAWCAVEEGNQSKVFLSVSEAIDSITRSEDPCHVLITGSVHLVGCALAILDPELSAPPTRISNSLKPLQNIYTSLQAVL